MIKKCKVILSNKEVMVVLYDNQEVQMSSKGVLYDVNTVVYVKYDKNKFTLSNKEDFDKAAKKAVGKKESKDIAEVTDNVEE